VRGPILVVAANTYREVGRDRMLHLLGALVAGFVLFAWVLGWMNPEESDQVRHLIDFGLAAVNLFGLLMAVFLGASLLRREMERRTLYTVLSREVTRTQFLVGKYLGLLGVFATGLSAVAVLMVAYFAVFGAKPGLPLVAAIYGNLLEIAVMTAASVLFGSFTTPAIAALGTVTMYVAGHATETLLDYLRLTRSRAMEVPFQVIYYAFPNLSDFNYRLAASFGDDVPLRVLGLATAYAVLWVAILLGAAALLFRRRELP
jgi:ABC-type transport system involved in multi-copper enzyme maturation permease subunit